MTLIGLKTEDSGLSWAETQSSALSPQHFTS
jgi:hypothetical protein